MKAAWASDPVCFQPSIYNSSIICVHRLSGPKGRFLGEGKWKNAIMEPFLLLDLIAQRSLGGRRRRWKRNSSVSMNWRRTQHTHMKKWFLCLSVWLRSRSLLVSAWSLKWRLVCSREQLFVLHGLVPKPWKTVNGRGALSDSLNINSFVHPRPRRSVTETNIGRRRFTCWSMWSLTCVESFWETFWWTAKTTTVK